MAGWNRHDHRLSLANEARMIKDAAEPAVRTVERWLEGFLALLPTLGVALIVFALMLGAALAAIYTLISVFRRSSRGELGVLLGGFVKWALILFGLLVVATNVFPSVKPADLPGHTRHRLGGDRLRIQGYSAKLAFRPSDPLPPAVQDRRPDRVRRV